MWISNFLNDIITILHAKYLADLLQAVAGDGDAVVDRRTLRGDLSRRSLDEAGSSSERRRVEAELIVAGVARGEHADPLRVEFSCGILIIQRINFFYNLTT